MNLKSIFGLNLQSRAERGTPIAKTVLEVLLCPEIPALSLRTPIAKKTFEVLP